MSAKLLNVCLVPKTKKGSKKILINVYVCLLNVCLNKCIINKNVLLAKKRKLYNFTIMCDC